LYTSVLEVYICGFMFFSMSCIDEINKMLF
jgi:hypothetical protein